MERQPKLECRVEYWWANTMITGTLMLSGNFYNLPDHKNGAFTTIEIIKLDMINMVAESEEAYIKL